MFLPQTQHELFYHILSIPLQFGKFSQTYSKPFLNFAPRNCWIISFPKKCFIIFHGSLWNHGLRLCVKNWDTFVHHGVPTYPFTENFRKISIKPYILNENESITSTLAIYCDLCDLKQGLSGGHKWALAAKWRRLDLEGHNLWWM